MKFYHANCVICHRDFFREDQVIAFRRGLRFDGIEPISLNGQQSWCGIVCICNQCAMIIAKEMF